MVADEDQYQELLNPDEDTFHNLNGTLYTPKIRQTYENLDNLDEEEV
jgi:hypothetical protein